MCLRNRDVPSLPHDRFGIKLFVQHGLAALEGATGTHTGITYMLQGDQAQGRAGNIHVRLTSALNQRSGDRGRKPTAVD
jgi:hypothetical protein